MDEKDRIARKIYSRDGQWSLPLLAAVLLLAAALLVACSGEQATSPEQTVISELLTVQPEMALTLTAWPTPLPILTLPPTPSAAPQALWTAEPADTELSTDEPVPTAEAPAPSPGVTGEPARVNPAAPTSNAHPTQLQIPSLGLDVPVVEVSWRVEFEDGVWHSQWQTVDDAAGHHRNSASPGELGNVVVSGHHNTGAEVFRDVSEIGMPGSPLEEGTEIVLVAADGSQHTYRVSSWERLQFEDIPDADRQSYARYMEPRTDPILTLITCWPYEGRSHRVIVIAELQASE
jgi:sortase A